MQRSAVVLGSIFSAAIGCSFGNPKFGDDGATGTATDETSGVGSTDATATASATASAGSTSGASGTAGSSSSTGASSTGDETTGAIADTVGPGDPTCPEGQGRELLMLMEASEDAGVIQPGVGEVCDWNPACAQLNYGNTGGDMFRMFKGDAAGTTVFLVRYPLEGFGAALAAAGVDPADVLGVRLQIVFYEPRDYPLFDKALDVAVMPVADVDWVDGPDTDGHGQNGGIAAEGESSYWRKVMLSADVGVPWHYAPGPLGPPKVVGSFSVNEADVQAVDADGQDPGAYHAKLMSTLIPIDLVKGLDDAATNPGFAVYLTTEVPYDTAFGLKPIESPHPNPALFVERCVPAGGGTSSGDDG